jgi:acetyltransferase (GNAT) family protein
MIVRALHMTPEPQFADSLAEFESQFTYPLGPGRSFRISHGDDYPRFFQAIGNAMCFVAERAGRVCGTLSVAVRSVTLPDGGQQQAAYIGDLKVDPAERGSMVFFRLAQAADAWARPQVTAAFGVVMDGTRVSPLSYTGRVGVPSFLELGKVIVLQVPTAVDSLGAIQVVPTKEGEDCYRILRRGRCVPLSGDPAVRSVIEPRWLASPALLACGRLEDTRRAKRLIGNDGIEMQSAHLTCFAWRTPRAAAQLIHAARHCAAQEGLPRLFVSLAEADMEALGSQLESIDKVIAPATVYGAGFERNQLWSINTSEI